MSTPVSRQSAAAPAAEDVPASPLTTPRSPMFGQVAAFAGGQSGSTTVIDLDPEVTGPPPALAMSPAS